MLVSEFIKFWSTVNKSQLSIRYFYKNKKAQLYKLNQIQDELYSIKINISQTELNPDDISIYSEKYNEYTYNQTQFYNTLRTQVPMGSFVYTLNIFIN